jgi:hypothetical protein
MKKYYTGQIFSTHTKACVADSSTGKITLIHQVNDLYHFDELVVSTTPDPITNISPFESYLRPYQECTHNDVLVYISGLKTYLDSL